MHDGHVKITRMGHAAVVIEVDDTRVLIDPGVFCPDETFELEDLDAIVVTHQHPDHLDRTRIGALLERNPGRDAAVRPGDGRHRRNRVVDGPHA